jgi:hypothetical protein
MVSERTIRRSLIVGLALLHGWWILSHGMHWGEDIDRFSRWGDALVARHFNPVTYLRDVRFVAPPVLYLGWVYVVAVAKVIAGSNWGWVILLLNWLAVMLIAWLVLTTVWRLTSSLIAVVVAGALLASFEILMLVNFPQSDILFLALATVVIVLAVRVAEEPSRRLMIGGTVTLLFACVFRPAAAPLVVIWLVALLGKHARRWVVPAILLATLLFAAIMQDASRWPFSPLHRWFGFLRVDYEKGTIVVGRPETWVAQPSSYIDYLAMIYRRWAYFFAIALDGYSKLHKIANFFYFIPAYVLALVALIRQRTAAIFMLFLAILVFSAFHGMQEVDYDHRYRLPILPPLIILASVGISRMLKGNAQVPERD